MKEKILNISTLIVDNQNKEIVTEIVELLQKHNLTIEKINRILEETKKYYL